MGYLQDWTKAKQTFESKTKQSKPSEKFWGVFRKSSGLENACKALDESLKKREFREMQKAEDKFRATSHSYAALLMQTCLADKSADYRTELRKLEQTLHDIAEEFSKERQEYLQELFKKVKGDLEKYEATVKKDYELVLGLHDKAAVQYQLCDKQLRDLSTRTAAGQTAEARKAATGLTTSFQALEKTVKDIERICTSCETQVKATLKRWYANNKELVANFKDECKKLTDDIEYLPTVMNVKRDRALRLPQDAKQLLDTAREILQGANDTEKIFAASLLKFVQRAVDLAVACNKDTETIEGQFDIANFQYLNTPEDLDEDGRAKRFATIRGNLKSQLKGISGVAARVMKANDTLEKEVAHYPDDLLTNPKYKREAGDIKEVFKMLEECREKLQTTVQKIQRLQVKVTE